MNATNVSFLVRLLVGGVCAGLLASCAPTLLPLGVDIGKIPGKISTKNEPISAALVIPEKFKNAISTLDVRCGGTYTVPVGIELMEGMLHSLSQVFDSVSLVDAKPAQSGEYDFVIEPALPELTIEGKNCYTRRALWVLFPVKLFYNPVDNFEAQTTLRVSMEDRTGKIIMNETFRSQRHNRVNDNNFSDVVPIAGALQSSFVDAIQRMSLGVVGTGQYRAYAQKGRKSPDQLQPAAATVVSDVDDAPKVSLPNQKNRFAVLIGIEQYRQQLPNVEFASHDAQIMREYLVKTLGYPEENVVTLLNQNATKADIEKHIERWLPNHVDKNSSVFVFYSGHGAPNAKSNEGYLVPYDGDPTFLEVTGYPLKRLYEQLGQLESKENFVVLDSCFSGSGGRSVMAKGTRPIVIVSESPALLSGKTVVLSASTGGQVSNTYSPKGHGLLTYFFLKGLMEGSDKSRGKMFNVQELFAYVKPSVQGIARREYNSEQTPQLIGQASVLRRMSLGRQPMLSHDVRAE